MNILFLDINPESQFTEVRKPVNIGYWIPNGKDFKIELASLGQADTITRHKLGSVYLYSTIKPEPVKLEVTLEIKESEFLWPEDLFK